MSHTALQSASSRKTGIMQAFVCLVLISAMPVLANARPASGAGTDALTFAFLLSVWQLLFSLPLFLHEARVGKKGLFDQSTAPKAKRRFLLAIVGTGMMFGLSTFLYVLSAKKAGAVGSALAIQAYPLFAIMWESLFLRRHKSFWELGFTALLIATLVYLATNGTFQLEDLSVWFLLALAIPLIWSIAHIILRELMGRTSFTPVQITTLRACTASLFLLAVMVVSGQSTSLPDAFFHGALQQAAALLGLVYYVELVIWFYAVRHIDVSLASSITVPSPAGTMVLAFIFLGDQIQTYQVIAMIVVMLSLYGLIFAGKAKSRGVE